MSDTPASRYESTLETYSVKVDGRRTTVRLEPEVMSALRDAAAAEDCSLADILTRIAHERRRGSLASALRLYAVGHYRARARDRLTTRLTAGLSPQPPGIRGTSLARDDGDYVLRHTLDLACLDHVDPCLSYLFVYWQTLTEDARCPSFAGFTLEALRARGFDANVHLVDVAADNPNDFHLIRQAPKTVICRIGDNVPLRRLGEGLYSREVRADYQAVKMGRAPVLQKVAVQTSADALSYQRIMLPYAGVDGRIDRLVIGVAAPSRLVPAGVGAPAVS